jgi:phospholipid/cholesterol/gamma-HCH transport system substrate-binding protein
MTRSASRIVRVVVIIAIALATTLLGYLIVNNFQFTHGRTILVHFTSVGDLNVGAWVRKSGLKVGSVTKMEPAEDEKTIMVTVQFRPGGIVRQGDTFALVAKGILGDMYIEQKPGPRESDLAEEGRLYEGEPSFNITDLLGGSTMDAVGDLASGLKTILAVLEANASALDATLKDVAASARNIRIVTDRAVVVTEAVPDITRQITDSVAKLQATVNDVSTTAGVVLDKLQGSVATSADDLSASMKSIRRVSDDVQTAVTALTAQNSIISTLGAPATAKSLETTLKNLEEISQGLLAVTRDTEKIVQGVGTIFQNP